MFQARKETSALACPDLEFLNVCVSLSRIQVGECGLRAEQVPSGGSKTGLEASMAAADLASGLLVLALGSFNVLQAANYFPSAR